MNSQSEWQYVTMSCGHVQLQNIGTPAFHMENREHFLKHGLCKKCAKEETNKRAAEMNKQDNLPVLQGTTKQIAWAEVIRRNLIDIVKVVDIDRLQEEMPELLKQATEYEKRRMAGIDRLIQSNTHAGWWIENRHEVSGWANKDCLNYLDELPQDEKEGLKSHLKWKEGGLYYGSNT